MIRQLVTASLALLVSAAPAAAQHLLVPMDGEQTDHLKAYGLTYWALEQGLTAEWLLNYRAGSFLLPDRADVRREAALRGVLAHPAGAGDAAAIRNEVADANMEVVILEKAPKIAVYTPSNVNPWDDAVTLALTYADISYDKLWDPEVVQGRLGEYDWLHLHHEDFTGQYSKFFITSAGAPWLQEAVRINEANARAAGEPNVPALKKRVAEEIRRYVAEGGFLFAMCTATETIELALAAVGVDIAAPFADGTPIDPDANAKMQWDRTMAFHDAEVQTNAGVNSFSDIDGHQVNTPWRQPLGAFQLFDFSAKFDPVPSMLVQNHEWTFLGGHDPEDPQHQIGDAPTDLALHPHSPGYRLILNNVLFPAARKKTLKT